MSAQAYKIKVCVEIFVLPANRDNVKISYPCWSRFPAYINQNKLHIHMHSLCNLVQYECQGVYQYVSAYIRNLKFESK